jgi:hypothetical protein
MTAYTLPAPDAPAEEWGRLAVALPGWRWMPGMRQIGEDRGYALRLDVTGLRGLGAWHGFHGHVGDEHSPSDPDDPATAGCLLALLGPLGAIMDGLSLAGRMDVWSRLMHALMHDPEDIGRACIAAAEAIGRWPGGEG